MDNNLKHQDILARQTYSFLNIIGGYVYSNLQEITTVSKGTGCSVSRAGFEGKANIITDMEVDGDDDVNDNSMVVN